MEDVLYLNVRRVWNCVTDKESEQYDVAKTDIKKKKTKTMLK